MGSLEDISCSDGRILDRVGCILTYGGSSATDIILNYCTMAINLACCILIVGSKTSGRAVDEKKGLSALLFVVFFQISLCLAVGCSGVSVIWCAMGGWIASQRVRAVAATPAEYHLLQQQQENQQPQQRLVYCCYATMIFDAAVVVYYFFAMPFITTVAHLCAVVMGALLSELSLKCDENKHN